MLTGSIEEVEARISGIDARFCEQGFFERTADREVRRLQDEQRDLRAKVATLLADWEKVEEQLAALGEG